MAIKKIEENVPMFTKEQLLSSKRYNDKKDIISAILHDERLYSREEVDALIEKFMKGKVK
ncbi:hypothetical protein [Lachnoclostridium phytofermentans]|uniref:Uncharacterized protein n=1 Tax=Lachnoclostridium phytofermentans (strain ATCC 700394 / DSM 18823 / ISDg) TaxID=357809 RepID=A9KQ04_LACP7|nr:hypothetical protein [Lachnoclostridium phytofermentans]ABX43316.1 hypothetical protein Cphy_2959 [Lachnoclostridium phytofermentans ISDg]